MINIVTHYTETHNKILPLLIFWRCIFYKFHFAAPHGQNDTLKNYTQLFISRTVYMLEYVVIICIT